MPPFDTLFSKTTLYNEKYTTISQQIARRENKNRIEERENRYW